MNTLFDAILYRRPLENIIGIIKSNTPFREVQENRETILQKILYITYDEQTVRYYYEIIKLLIQNKLVNVMDKDAKIGNTALHDLIFYKRYNFNYIYHEPILQLIIDNGANPNDVNIYGETPLHYAVIFQKNIELFRFLLRIGCQYNIPNRDGNTPYDYAQCLGKHKVLELFNSIKKHDFILFLYRTSFRELSNSQKSLLIVPKKIQSVFENENIIREICKFI